MMQNMGKEYKHINQASTSRVFLKMERDKVVKCIRKMEYK
jgi:hypothetical protein